MLITNDSARDLRRAGRRRLNLNLTDKSAGIEPYITGVYLDEAEDSISLSLSATDTIDTLVSSLQNIVSTTISATDAKDTSDITTKNIISYRLSVTDAKDTAEMSSTNTVSMSVQTTDTKDVSEITATVDTSATLEVTEKQDTALIKVSGRIVIKKTSAGSANLIPLILKLKKSNVILQASENQDGMSATLIKETGVKARISEQSDGMNVTAQVKQVAVMAISESNEYTVITDEDKDRFKKYVAEVYRRYEENQIRTLLAVA